MFEKVNPSHPDKLADRIAGAIVDLAYKRPARLDYKLEGLVSKPQKVKEDPKIAVEVLLGHGCCKVIIETDQMMNHWDVVGEIRRISGLDDGAIDVLQVQQDKILAKNQEQQIRCGDNGIFLGMPITEEEKTLTELMKKLYRVFPSDGKAIIDKKGKRLVICQSMAPSVAVKAFVISKLNELGLNGYEVEVNPLGDWSGGTSVDSGATNRKLGSDMGMAVTGGGIHGKDLSKADVTLNIFAHMCAQEWQEPVALTCAIGDETINGKPYGEIVEMVREYIQELGGFEELARWGLIR